MHKRVSSYIEPPKEEISTGLRLRRGVRRAFALAALILFASLVALALDLGLSDGSKDMVRLGMNSSFFALIVCGILLRLMPCPRCGEFFVTGGLFFTEIWGRCSRCGLKWNGSNI